MHPDCHHKPDARGRQQGARPSWRRPCPPAARVNARPGVARSAIITSRHHRVGGWSCPSRACWRRTGQPGARALQRPSARASRSRGRWESPTSQRANVIWRPSGENDGLLKKFSLVATQDHAEVGAVLAHHGDVTGVGRREVVVCVEADEPSTRVVVGRGRIELRAGELLQPRSVGAHPEDPRGTPVEGRIVGAFDAVAGERDPFAVR